MRHSLAILILVIVCTACGTSDRTVDVYKPRLHKTWPKKHKWHKKLKIWKFTIQQPERGGLKKVKMKS
jgi:hypothetical protein